MGLVLMYSIFIKGLGAIFEIIIQIFITRSLGVGIYGTYSYYISLIDILFWFFFSGLMKCNIYYLSDNKTSIAKFKIKYFGFYMLPILVCVGCISMLLKVPFLGIILTTVILQFVLQDQSSTFIARGKSNVSMTLEYFVSRVFLLTLLIIMSFVDKLNINTLLLCYLLQFGFVIVLYWVYKNKRSTGQKKYIEKKVDNKKLIQYQISDMANGLISQAPMILQYLFVGAFETAFLGLLSIVRKLISFISGPTSKVFLPIFSQSYIKNDIKGLLYNYSLITKIQMFFIAGLGVLVLVFPELVLKLFSPDLLIYKNGLIVVGFVFLTCTSLGPVTGFMQMTGSEKKENKIRMLTIILMIIVWFLFRHNPLFALYGIVVQMVSETLLKFIYICNWFKKIPINIVMYIFMWIPFIIYRLIIIKFNLEFSFIAAMLISILNVIITTTIMMFDKETRNIIKKFIYRKVKGI